MSRDDPDIVDPDIDTALAIIREHMRGLQRAERERVASVLTAYANSDGTYVPKRADCCREALLEAAEWTRRLR